MNNVSIYNNSVVAQWAYTEQHLIHEALKELADDYRIDFELHGDKITMQACGYVEEHPLQSDWHSSVEMWCKGFDSRMQAWIDSLPDDEDEYEDELTIGSLLPYAADMGMAADEFYSICEDMCIPA